MNKINRKGQIVIFVILAFIILLIFFSLLFFRYGEIREEISIAEETSYQDLEGKLFPLKDRVDYCLNLELRRAVVRAGMSGGFIYDEGEKYIGSFVPDGTYTGSFISGLGLNWNFLIGHTLVSSQEDVFFPSIDFKVRGVKFLGGDVEEIYGHTIKEDFEDFIEGEFLRCIDFGAYEEAGYEVVYNRSVGNIVDVFDGADDVLFLAVSGLEGDEGDRILIEFPEGEIYGMFLRYDDEGRAIVELSEGEGLVTAAEIFGFEVVNLDSDVDVDVFFNDESVDAQLSFPVVLRSRESEVFYNRAFAKINVRFRKILEFAEALFFRKKFDRDFDLRDEEQINEVLNGIGYWKETGDKEIAVFERAVVDSKEEKQYVYSIVDYDGRIGGYPFVFNFGYENSAPEIDLSNLEEGSILDEGVLFNVVENEEVVLDLKPLTYDRQFFDNFVSFFVADERSSSVYDYSLSSDGILRFEGFVQGRFPIEIVVSDGETERSHNFVFMTGFPDNTDNKAARECFGFSGPEFFPVEDEFEKSYFFDEDGEEVVFAYSLYSSDSAIVGDEKFVLNFKHSCFLTGVEDYSAEYFFVDLRNGEFFGQGVVGEDGLIEVVMKSFPVEVVVEVKDGLGKLVTEAFKFRVYPASCLGPHPVSDPVLVEKYGGAFSCCDTSGILSSLESGSPRAFVGADVLRKDEVAFDYDSYFCFDGPYLSDRVLWDVEPKITSLFRGRVFGVCDGVFPQGKLTGVGDAGDRDLVLKSGSFEFSGGEEVRPIDLFLKVDKDAGKCEFCSIESGSEFVFNLDNGFFLRSGLVADNPSAGVFPLPDYQPYRDVLVLADTRLYATLDRNDVYSWRTGEILGKGGDFSPARIYAGRQYCEPGVSDYFKYSGISSRRDSLQGCADWFFDGANFARQPALSSWVCGFGGFPISCVEEDNVSNVLSGFLSYDRFCSGVDYFCSGCGNERDNCQVGFVASQSSCS